MLLTSAAFERRLSRLHEGATALDYEKGRGKTSGDGSLEALFAGEHGWFWRNRDKADVTVTLQLRGTYRALNQSQ